MDDWTLINLKESTENSKKYEDLDECINLAVDTLEKSIQAKDKLDNQEKRIDSIGFKLYKIHLKGKYAKKLVSSMNSAVGVLRGVNMNKFSWLKRKKKLKKVDKNNSLPKHTVNVHGVNTMDEESKLELLTDMMEQIKEVNLQIGDTIERQNGKLTDMSNGVDYDIWSLSVTNNKIDKLI